MKHRVLSSLLLMFSCAPALAGWNYSMTVAAGQTGLNRIELSTGVIDQSLPDFADVRLRTPAGADIAYYIVQDRLPGISVTADIHEEGELTVALLDFGRPEEVTGLRFDIGAADFVKSVTVKAGVSAADLRAAAVNKQLFRQGGKEKLDLSFAPVSCRFLRVEFDNSNTPTVGITRVSPVFRAGIDARLNRAEVPFTSVVRGRDTVLTLQLPARNLYISDIELGVAARLYNRQVRLVSEKNRFSVQGCVASAAQAGCGRGFPVRRQLAGENTVELIIADGDLPALPVKTITIFYPSAALVFDSPAPAAYKLFFGNRTARAPEYGQFADKTPPAKIPPAKFGAIEPNVSGASQELMALIAPAAGPLTPADWKLRRAIKVSSAGFAELELPADVLNAAHSELYDIRVTSGDIQVPYVFGYPRKVETLAAPHAETKNGVTTFSISFPYANVPMRSLSVSTQETVAFSRAVRLYRSERDARGVLVKTMLESRVWNYNPEELNGTLVFALQGRSSGSEFFVEIDNGSNVPVSISGAALCYDLPAIIFRAAAGSYTLLYGNTRAPAAQYDIYMLRNRLLNAETTEAVLNGPARDNGGMLDSPSGKYALVSALALVAGLLVWAVVKVMPKTV